MLVAIEKGERHAQDYWCRSYSGFDPDNPDTVVAAYPPMTELFKMYERVSFIGWIAMVIVLMIVSYIGQEISWGAFAVLAVLMVMNTSLELIFRQIIIKYNQERMSK